MDLRPTFSFRPIPEIKTPIHFPFPKIPNPLGPLASLPGSWRGKGFNTIWRPNNTPGQDRFLELNLTDENLDANAISGPIPNRGLLQPDMNMFGVHYLQQIQDSNVHAGLHFEPGIWATVPHTTDPNEPPTVVRMASIPHGTTILAQGQATSIAGPPNIPNINIDPFPIGNPAGHRQFPEQNLAQATPFRTPPADMAGVTQAMVNNPNSVLQTAIAGQHITHTMQLDVTTVGTPVAGGGTSNTAFLKGTQHGPNADAVQVMSTFWIETVQAPSGSFLQLQYSQTVLLNFNTLSWPHVTVGTLRKKVPISVIAQWVDPLIPLDLLKKVKQPNE